MSDRTTITEIVERERHVEERCLEEIRSSKGGVRWQIKNQRDGSRHY